MPQSKKRVHAHPQQPHPTNTKTTAKKGSKLIITGIIFFGLIGLGTSFFMADANPLWLIVGTLVGVFIGYIFGKEMNKTLSKK